MIWDREAETMPRKELGRLQTERLKALVQRVNEKVPFYRRAFQEKGIAPADIRGLEDLQKLPFTTKRDFRDNYPFGLLAVPLGEVARVHASSGTTGKPTAVAYTRKDLDLWAQVMARTLTAGDVARGDIVHNAYGYGLFTGGLGVHYGVEKVGATVVPVSGGNTKRQVMLIHDFGATALTCTPSFSLYLAEVAAEMGADLRASQLKVGFFGAEPWTEAMRQEIEDKLGLLAIDIYGLSEVIGPGVSTECTYQDGLHICDDHFLPEVIDPATGEVLPDGQKGELVFTTLTKEALPIIRFRTGDITSLNHETCRCGRTSVRMAKVSGRTDDMIIVRGVNVFPSQVESVLLEIEGLEPQYLIVVDRQQRSLDDLEVWVEVSAEVFSDEVRRLERLQEKVERELESVLGIRAAVRLVEPQTIARSEGKARRVVDRREL